MANEIKALLVDDDSWALKFLTAKLKESIPELIIEARDKPDITGDFDIYFIDNDFNGEHLAAQLARRIRALRPDALVVAFSGTLDFDTLKELLNSGCDGACDKSNPNDLPKLIEIAAQFVHARKTQPATVETKSEGKGILGAIRSINQLLNSWNARLDKPKMRVQRIA